MKITVTIFPTDLVTNSLLSSLYSLSCKPKQNRNKVFSKLVVYNNKYFCFLFITSCALLQKAMPNSIDFCKGIFLHVIPVRIIVPWLN